MRGETPPNPWGTASSPGVGDLYVEQVEWRHISSLGLGWNLRGISDAQVAHWYSFGTIGKFLGVGEMELLGST